MIFINAKSLMEIQAARFSRGLFNVQQPNRHISIRRQTLRKTPQGLK
jgi:hypothetical protein